jgi:FkbM family methyltransferase
LQSNSTKTEVQRLIEKLRSGFRRRRDAIVQTMASPELPLPAKLQFIRHGFWLRSPRPGAYRLRLGKGELFLSYANNETDRNVVWDVFINRCYRPDFRNSTVVDVGAHKGYFSAYALLHGAKRVISYEPERENFEFLTQTAGSFLEHGSRWETNRMAVAASEGEVELRIDPASWAHSIVPIETSRAIPSTDVQVVACRAMVDLLESVALNAPEDRLIVKIDAEGAECEMVLDTPKDAWRVVDEVLIEVHDFASCSAGELVDHLEGAGLLVADDIFGVLHIRRPAE